MHTLEAQKREKNVKAKALRRQGFVIGNLTGKEIEDSQPLKFSQTDATKFVKENKDGAHITLLLDGKKIDAMLEKIDYNSMKNEITSIDFQQLNASEKVHGIAQIKLLNEDKTNGYVTQDLSEIKYKALPANMVEEIQIDLMNYKIGDSVHVSDLAISKDKNVDVTSPADSLVFSIANHTNGQLPESDEEGETSEEA